jgi:hypothetical protein
VSEPVEIQFAFRNQRFADAGRGLDALSRTMNRSLDEAAPVLSRELKTFLEGVAEAMARRHGTAWPGGTSDRTLSRRSGRLIASIKESVTVRGQRLADIEGGIGGAVYLRTHEHGATIRPKKAKYLAIPLPEALNADGTPKLASPRQWKNTFVARSKNGNLLIFQRRGRHIVPLYVLKREVKIRPRLGLGDTLRAGLPHFVDRAMSRMARAMLEDRP